MPPATRIPAVVALIGALLGLVFATYSTDDYAAHLDRQLHDVHCSVIPGAAPKEEAPGCRAALYSPYSAVLKDSLWGGIPISLFAQGSFAFFGGFAVYLLVAGDRASRSAAVFYAAVAVTPLLVSIGMFIISLTQLNTVCETCVGTYLASLLVALGGGLGLIRLHRRPRGGWLLPIVWLAALGLFTLLPTFVYASTAPDHRPYLGSCGTLKKTTPPEGVLLALRGSRPVRQVLFFEDPLCATCKAVHLRLKDDGVLERLDAQMSLLPLDNQCNWMLDRPLHPGACQVVKAVLCGQDRAKEVLEWAYQEQEYLLRAGKADLDAGHQKEAPVLREVIRRRWGDAIIQCMDSQATKQRLEKHLQYAVDNSIAVSTPQIYLGNQRICDEDTDLGLRFTLKELAPEVLP
ncbi:MAG: hypothetical protein JW751_04430 [Polyangiaceae bacterium]|nr:hypothetical protein [Polyangiaceae bacterium]